MKYAFAIIVFLVSICFGGFGAYENLQKRAIHADEAEQATTFLKLYQDGEYKYNPNGPHGPTLYYWANWTLKATNDIPHQEIKIATLRKSMLVVSAIALLSIFILSSEIGIGSCLCASAMFAGTSLLQIYGSYFVQEIIFTLFVFTTTAMAWLFLKEPTIKKALLLGISAGIVQATKETSVIAFLSTFVGATIVAIVSKNIRNSIQSVSIKSYTKFALVIISAFVVVCVVWYSSFANNWQGVVDAVKSYYIHFFNKAGMSEHSGEGLFYIKLLFLQKSSGVYFGEILFTILSIIGFIWATCKSSSNVKSACVMFFGICAITNIAVLSIITYKTPWLILSGIMLMSICTGYALWKIFELPIKFSLPIVILLCVFYWFFQFSATHNAVNRFHSDPRNPFIYSHTVSDENNLANRLLKCSQYSEFKTDIPIAFVCKVSPWPLPWQLRNLKNTGFWNTPPENINDFDVVVCDSFLANEVAKKLDTKNYEADLFGLRKNTILTVYIKKTIFKKIIEE